MEGDPVITRGRTSKREATACSGGGVRCIGRHFGTKISLLSLTSILHVDNFTIVVLVLAGHPAKWTTVDVIIINLIARESVWDMNTLLLFYWSHPCNERERHLSFCTLSIRRLSQDDLFLPQDGVPLTQTHRDRKRRSGSHTESDLLLLFRPQVAQSIHRQPSDCRWPENELCKHQRPGVWTIWESKFKMKLQPWIHSSGTGFCGFSSCYEIEQNCNFSYPRQAICLQSFGLSSKQWMDGYLVPEWTLGVARGIRLVEVDRYEVGSVSLR